MKKYVAEFIGTMLLVVCGCGGAVAINSVLETTIMVPVSLSVLPIAFAFGLSVLALSYIFGSVSGCHVNPAVSLGMVMTGRIKFKEFVGYVIAQFIGGIAGAGILIVFFGNRAALGANTYGALSAITTTTAPRAFLIETILTFIFVLVVLSITAKAENSKISGIVIGLTLTLVHIVGVPFTGTSVNPARSFGPALLTGTEALKQVWLFILAPLLGAVIAAIVYLALIDKKNKGMVPHKKKK